VWLHLTKERFPSRGKSELMARGDGPVKVLAKVGANTYKLKLPRDMVVSVNFNMGDINPYEEDDIKYRDLRANPFKGEEDDTD